MSSFKPIPILKSASPHSMTSDLSPATPPNTHSALHHVHFSATTHTFPTHSNRDYDRTPTRVLKNPCEMPARGCPGITYVPIEGVRKKRSNNRSRLPQLIPDISESEESDCLISPPSEVSYSEGLSSDDHDVAHVNSPIPHTSTTGLSTEAMAFLPHLNPKGPIGRKTKGKSFAVPLAQLDDSTPESRGCFRPFSVLSTLGSPGNDCLGGF